MRDDFIIQTIKVNSMVAGRRGRGEGRGAWACVQTKGQGKAKERDAAPTEGAPLDALAYLVASDKRSAGA
jgi:hypothetical protein